jgi:GDP-L-fucose synthase
MKAATRIFVAGGHGLVGSALIRKLESEGHRSLLVPTHADLDLIDQAAVNRFFAAERPEHVFLVAGKVGGILANSTHPAEFLRDNLLIQANVIDAAYRCGALKLLNLGSSCIYPKLAPQPITEDCLLTGAFEPTNECYAIAKVAGLKMCQAYRRQYDFNAVCMMPTNLYGPGDNFDLQGSHVLPAMIRKFHEAKVEGSTEVLLWGTGTPRREFLHVDDLAEACLFVMRNYNEEAILNVGVGEDVTIRQLAEIVKTAVGYKGALAWDATKPDGTPRKLLEISRLQRLGWRARIGLQEGIAGTYRWFLDHRAEARVGQNG